MDEDSRSAQTSLFDEGSGAATGGSGEHADPSGADSTPDDEERGSPAPKGGATVVRSPAAPARGRATFALGRTDRRTTELRVIDDAASPISGPFRVKAVVRDRDARRSREPSEG